MATPDALLSGRAILPDGLRLNRAEPFDKVSTTYHFTPLLFPPEGPERNSQSTNASVLE